MEPAEALADLTEISPEIETATVLDDSRAVLASTLEGERSREVGRLASELLAAADGVRSRLGEQAVTQLQVALLAGSVFVVRDGGRLVVATTSPEPTVGLVLYDVRTCLRNIQAGADVTPERPEPAERDG